jgi:hypothetical protein
VKTKKGFRQSRLLVTARPTTPLKNNLSSHQTRAVRYFLIDSAVPTLFVNHQVKPGLLKLCTPNATELDAYGEQNIELHLNIRISFKWNFIIANVRSGIAEVDCMLGQ